MSVETMLVTESVQGEPDQAVELPERTYDRVLYFAEQVLRQEEVTSDQATMKGSSVIETARERFDEAKIIPEKTFSRYLSEAARDPASKINTRGRGKGYYLAEVVDEIPSQEILPEEQGDTEQEARRNQGGKLQRSCLMEMDMRGSEMNLDMKTKKVVQGLQELGRKYGCGSPPEYTIEAHYQFSCKIADGTNMDIIVVIREGDISVFYRPNPPEWFDGNNQIEDALKEVERLLKSPNEASDT